VQITLAHAVTEQKPPKVWWPPTLSATRGKERSAGIQGQNLRRVGRFHSRCERIVAVDGLVHFRDVPLSSITWGTTVKHHPRQDTLSHTRAVMTFCTASRAARTGRQ
jgi:hypothetical protein